MSSREALMFDTHRAPAIWRRTNSTPVHGLVGGIAAEIRATYPGIDILASSNELSIPQAGRDGFPVGLILLENNVFYLNLGLAEFDVHDPQVATDILILSCSRDCRLRTTYLGDQLRDWFLDLHSNNLWRCIHSGGFPRFAPWRSTATVTKMNPRPLGNVGKAARRRILSQFQLSNSEPTTS